MRARPPSRSKSPTRSAAATRRASSRSSSTATATLYLGSAGKFDVARNVPMPTNAIFNDRVDDQAGHLGRHHDAARAGQAEARRSGVEVPATATTSCRSSRTSTRRTRTYETRPAKSGDDDPPPAVAHVRHRLRVHQPDRVRAHGQDEEGRMGTAAARRPGHEVELLAPARASSASSSKRSPASPLEAWYQEHIFKPLGMVDTSYAVAADKQSRGADESQPLHRHDGRAAPDADSRRRRRRRSAATAGSTQPSRTTASSCACC